MWKKDNSLIKKLYIEPTSRCNLSCKMCFRHSWIDEDMGDMSESIFFWVLEYIMEYKPETVFFGGMGEPLIHNNICNMIKESAEFTKNVELITNASLLNKDMSENLVNSGLSCLWISMDGFSSEEYEKIRLGGRFEKLTENIKIFNRARSGKKVKLGITFVVMEENESQLELINGFCDEFGVDIINISHAIPSDSKNSAREFYEKKTPVGKMKRIGDEISEYKKDSCPFINDGACFVKWNGEVLPCMQILHSSVTYMFDIRREVFSYSFGNVLKNSLYDIYTSDKYRMFRENVLNFDFPACTVCDGCEMRESNLEDCMFNEKPTCGACLWATGKVFCP